MLLIGLDACDKDLVLHWSKEGLLPTFKFLLENGIHGTTANPPGFFGGTVWPSFATGVSPAKHRRFCARQAARGAYIDAPFTPNDIQGIPFWNHLSAAGRKVAVIDAPHCKLSHRLNGCQLIDWATHDPYYQPPLSWPPELFHEITVRFGEVVPDQCDSLEGPDFRHNRAGIEDFVNRLLKRLSKSSELTHYLLDQNDWDLFITVFSESHCAGHQCWHLHDPNHPFYDHLLAREVGDPLKIVYQALDTAISGLLDHLDPQSQVLVLLSHGMGPMYNNPDVILDEILQRLERASLSLRGEMFRQLKQTWYSLPGGVRQSPLLRTLKKQFQPSLHHAMLVPGRRYRKYYAVPADTSVGAVRINLTGREPFGRVAPGLEYKNVVMGLRRDLADLINPVTGTPFVKAIYFTPDLFDGPYLDELPDLLLEWNRDEYFPAIFSPKIGTLEVPAMVGRTGDHKNAGMFIMLGPSIKPIQLDRTVSIMDFAPTICQWFGITAAGMDGHVVKELFS